MERMEKRILANVCRGCLILFALSFAAVTSHAQLINGGFDTTGTNYVFPDNGDGSFPLLTNVFAAGWLPSGGSYVTRDSTNSPIEGSYEDEYSPNYDYYGLNQTGTNITARSGAYALRAFGPDTNLCCGASYAYQAISNSVSSQPVTNGQIWVASGYALVWSGDPMTNLATSTGFGNLQLAFLNASNTTINSYDGPHVLDESDPTNPAPMNVWISCSVTATAPYSAKSIVTQVRVYVGHVGMTGALGSIFWDDITLTNIGVAPPPPPIPTNQFQAVIQTGNQICWPTISNASYQPQFSDDNSSWTNIGSLLPGDGTSNCVFAATHKYYRVLQLQ
jgi:hypothetical protein